MRRVGEICDEVFIANRILTEKEKNGNKDEIARATRRLWLLNEEREAELTIQGFYK